MIEIGRLTAADAGAARALYADAKQAGSLDFWPFGIAPTFELERYLDNPNILALGVRANGELAGFFIVERQPFPFRLTNPPLPESYIGRDSWELQIWFIRRGLPRQAYARHLNDLFDTGWFSRVRGKLCWGQLPYDLIPARARQFLDAKFRAHFDYVEEGIKWRIWVYEP